MSISQRSHMSLFTIAILCFLAGVGTLWVVQMFSATTAPPKKIRISNKVPNDIAPSVLPASSGPASTSKYRQTVVTDKLPMGNDIVISPSEPPPSTLADPLPQQQVDNYIRYNSQPISVAPGTDYAIGIFERVLEASDNFDKTTAALEQALSKSGLILHAKHDLALVDMQQRARVYILTSPTYMEAAENAATNTISAQILRIGVYEYGEGKKVYINMANPVAHAMVFYAGTRNYSNLVATAASTAQVIRDVAAQVPGTLGSVQQEPTRSEKALNKFNGDGPAKMMAKFRNWSESQSVVFSEKPENFNAVVARVEKMLRSSQDKGAGDPSGWRLLSKIPVGANAVYFGITNDYTETKLIRINSDYRSDGKSRDAPYPGVDHTPALPLEVLVINTGKDVHVVQYGQMWRMQLYFWDSGYLAFTKNTLIPATIFGSIDRVLTATVPLERASNP